MTTPAMKKNSITGSGIRYWLARNLGVSPERKEEVYLDLCRSASLRDFSYWLQILFASGIAILGLVLNSPAVIIGAMLISPLMGPILSGGLALASGDIILGARALVNLVLSCLLAVLFAFVLVRLLPFKEMTAEIAARTQPNTLDLVVTLFSGAVGSIAVSREIRGVVTSIPGVAIAVNLMRRCKMADVNGQTIELKQEISLEQMGEETSTDQAVVTFKGVMLFGSTLDRTRRFYFQQVGFNSGVLCVSRIMISNQQTSESMTKAVVHEPLATSKPPLRGMRTAG